MVAVTGAAYKTGYDHGSIVGAEFTDMVIYGQNEEDGGKDANKGPKDVN